MAKPLCVDLFCGLGGWAEGFLAEGYDVIGFDIERRPYPGQLVLQDVLTLHGSQFRDAACIVASPPCQEYSYMAMPWSRAKQIRRGLHGQDFFPTGYDGPVTIAGLNALFDACFRIQREASEAARHYIPMVVENVKGAQPWVGRAKWHYGSFYLWGDVPALMPFARSSKNNGGGGWFAIGNAKNKHCPDGRTHTRNLTPNGMANGILEADAVGQNPDGRKGFTKRFEDMPMAWLSSKSNARKAASAQIAKIPFPLAQYIAQVYHPRVDSPEPARNLEIFSRKTHWPSL